MSKSEKQAWDNGVTDKMMGYFAAIKRCKEAAKDGSKEAAAYVRGFENNGVGE